MTTLARACGLLAVGFVPMSGGILARAPGPQVSPPPTIDGLLYDTEWRGAMPGRLVGGGSVYVVRHGDFVFVAVRGPGKGLASLCAAGSGGMRILHASAAVGEARYERDGSRWIKRTDFDWRLRGSPSEADKASFLTSMGWLANASAIGSPDREFQIRADQVDALGVTFLSTTEPPAVSYWPQTMKDDCRSVKVAQGFLPDAADFQPSGWHQVKR